MVWDRGFRDFGEKIEVAKKNGFHQKDRQNADRLKHFTCSSFQVALLTN